MKREIRYMILKIKDVNDALNNEERQCLEELFGKVDAYRYTTGKDDLECVVVERDWPEYEKVWHMIEKRVDLENVNDKTTEEFSDMIGEETEQNVKHIQTMISEDDKK